MSWERDKERLGKEIIVGLYKHGMIKTWFKDNPKGWRLVSGLWSPLYIQLELLASYPELLQKAGYALSALIKEECNDVNRVIGVATAGIPIATTVSLISGIPSCYTRKLEGVRSLEDFNRFVKEYGEHSVIEGVLEEGDTVGIIDGLATKFDSKLVALGQLKFEIKLRGLKNVQHPEVIVLLDREQGAEKIAKKHGMHLHSLIPFASKGMKWLEGAFAEQEYEVIVDYLRNTEKYQDPDLQIKMTEIALEAKQGHIDV